MSLFVILFANVALGQVSTIASFGDYVASQSEAFELNLYDYFTGPNLKFSVNSTTLSSWNVTASDPFNIVLSDQQNITGSSVQGSLSRTLKVRQYVDSTSTNCILAWSGQNLTSYCISDNSLEYSWSVLVASTLTNASISDVAVDPSSAYIYAIVGYTFMNVTYSTVYVGGTSKPPAFSGTSGYLLTGSNCFRIEVSSQYAAILNTTSNSPNSPGEVSVYNISNPLNGKLVATSNYSQYPVDLGFLDSQTLIVASSSVGLVKYTILNSTLNLVGSLPKSGITSLDISDSVGVVSLSSQAIQVDLNEMVVENEVDLYSPDGSTAATAVGGKLVGGYSFVNTIVGSTSNLAVVNFDLLSSQGLVCTWSLSSYQSSQFNAYAPFNVLINSDGSYSYVRVDQTTVTLASLTVGSWNLIGFTSSMNYSANVTAYVRANPGINATLTFSGTSLSPNSVVPYANNSIISNPVSVSLDTSSEYIGLSSVIYPSMYFGGAFQSYNISVNPTANITAYINQTGKLNATSIYSFNYTIMYASGPVVALSDGTTISAYNASSQSLELNYEVTAYEVSSILLSNGGIVWYSSQYSLISAYFQDAVVTVPVENLDCLQLKEYNGQVFCGNSESITVLEFQPSSPNIIATITNETFNLESLEFSDFTFGTGVSGSDTVNYMFLVQSSGISSFQIDDLAGSLTLSPFATLTNVNSVFTTGDQLVVVEANGSVDIYSVNYGALPTILRSIPGDGGLVSAAASDTILALQYPSYTVVVDLYAEALKALYTSYNSSSSCSLSVVTTTLDSVLSLCPDRSSSSNTTELSITQVLGARFSSTSALLYPVTISIVSTSPYIETSATLVTGNITASNSFGSASLNYSVVVTNHSPYLVSLFSHKPLSVEYDTELIISDLLQYFIGQNVELYLNINGNYSTFDFDSFSYQPVILYPKVYLSDVYNNWTITDISTCTGCNYSFALGPSDIYFLQYSNETITVVNSLNLSNSNYSCNSFEAYPIGNEIYQFFINCNSTYTNGTITQTTSNSIYYTWDNVTDYPIATTASNTQFEFIKAVPISNSSFIVYQVTNNIYSQGVFSNTRFTSSYFYYYNKPSYSLNTTEYNFASFDLPSLKISAIDSYFVALNQAIVYMADASGYIQVFNVTLDQDGDNTINNELVQSISTGSMIPVSIGVCDQVLLVGGYGEEVYSYSLTPNASNPTFVSSYYTTGLFNGTRGNIDCNADYNPSYAAVPMFQLSGNTFTTRILDLNAANTSAIYIDLTYDYPYDYHIPTGAIEFLSNNTVRGLVNSTMIDYQINRPYLDIQSMNYEQYEKMKAAYSTDTFTLFFTATNDNKTVNSSSFTLVRTVRSDDSDSAFALYAAFLVGIVSLI